MTGRLADFPRRDVVAVVTDQPAGSQQHRNRGCTNLLSGDALLEQPLDQLGALRAGVAFQAVEQLLDFGFIHVVKV